MRSGGAAFFGQALSGNHQAKSACVSLVRGAPRVDAGAVRLSSAARLKALHCGLHKRGLSSNMGASEFFHPENT
jgi:hypothetical protein